MSRGGGHKGQPLNPLEAYIAVAKAEGLTPAVRCVAMMLVDFAANDEKGLAWPSQNTLSQRAGCRRETANKAVAYLVEHGAGRLRFEIVERRTPKGGGRPYNVYRLSLVDASETHIAQNDPSETRIDSSRSRIDSSETHTIKSMNKSMIRSTPPSPPSPPSPHVGEGGSKTWGSGSSWAPPRGFVFAEDVVALFAEKGLDLNERVAESEEKARADNDPVKNWNTLMRARGNALRAVEPVAGAMYEKAATQAQRLLEARNDAAKVLGLSESERTTKRLRAEAVKRGIDVTVDDLSWTRELAARHGAETSAAAVGDVLKVLGQGGQGKPVGERPSATPATPESSDAA